MLHVTISDYTDILNILYSVAQ